VVWPAQFGQAGLALPLDRYLPAGYWKRFPARRAAGTRYRGAHLAAPFFTDEGFLVYRKDLLRAAHLPVPTTWEQLTSEARRLQRAHRVKYGYAGQFAGYEGLTCNWMEFATDAGATVLNPAGTRATVDSPAAARALRFMRSLITSGVSPRAMTTFQEQQAQQLFTAGQSAFLRNWGYAYDDANNPATSHVVGKVGIARLPGFAGRRAPGYATIGGWNLMINPHSRHLGADLAFVKWMTGGTAQRMLAAASEIPAVSSVLDDPAVTAASPVLRTAAHNVLVSRPSGTPAYAEVSLSLYTNLNAALSGSRTPGPALAAAARGINTALGPGGL
jgi:multiple sugar transport system substrate-binding protein